jgi:hypothetical protein
MIDTQHLSNVSGTMAEYGKVLIDSLFKQAKHKPL